MSDSEAADVGWCRLARDDHAMSTRDRRLDRATDRERTIAGSVRRELIGARRAVGMSRRELGKAVGLSEGMVARFESGADLDIGIGRLARMSAGLGLDLSVRLYPAGDPVRDAGSLRLERRIRARIAPVLRWRSEVPVAGNGLRAWDAVVDGTGCVDAFELETRVGDVQATERRLHLKLRDDPSVRHLFLVIADTRHGRSVLAAARGHLRESYPLDTREILAAFGAGRCPGASGSVVI